MEVKRVQKCLKKFQKLTLFLVIHKEKKTTICMEIQVKMAAFKMMNLIAFLMIYLDKMVLHPSMSLMTS
jgi:hypothetical protein